MIHRFSPVAAAAAMLLAGGAARAATVYTMSNASTGNALAVFRQTPSGALRPAGLYPTGGNGAGGFLINQGALALAQGGRFVLVVNPGSNSVSVFRAGRPPQRTAVVDSQGSYPVSVAARGRVVFVLNQGSDSVAGFTLGRDGTLTPIPGATRSLGRTAAGAAQIAFSADGRNLIVVEHFAGVLALLPLGEGNVPGAPVNTVSAGRGAFGFGVAPDGTVAVSETVDDAGGRGSLSTYRIVDGALRVVSPRVSARQTATCWVALTPDGAAAYATNTLSGTVTRFALAADGSARRVPADGVSGQTAGDLPLDAAVNSAGTYLYTINIGGTISVFSIGADGGLALRSTRRSDVPSAANGIVASGI